MLRISNQNTIQVTYSRPLLLSEGSDAQRIKILVLGCWGSKLNLGKDDYLFVWRSLVSIEFSHLPLCSAKGMEMKSIIQM